MEKAAVGYTEGGRTRGRQFGTPAAVSLIPKSSSSSLAAGGRTVHAWTTAPRPQPKNNILIDIPRAPSFGGEKNID